MLFLSKNLLSHTSVDWENTKNYDEVMVTIGRNRKLIYNKFLNLEQRKIKINFEMAKQSIKEILDFCKIKVEDKNWPILLKFAEGRDGVIDYKRLLETYKNRVNRLMAAPNSKTIFI
jgi:hypothetical protein